MKAHRAHLRPDSWCSTPARKLAEGSPKEIVNDPRVMAAYLGDKWRREGRDPRSSKWRDLDFSYGGRAGSCAASP